MKAVDRFQIQSRYKLLNAITRRRISQYILRQEFSYTCLTEFRCVFLKNGT